MQVGDVSSPEGGCFPSLSLLLDLHSFSQDRRCESRAKVKLGVLLPFPELPKFSTAIQARCAAVVGTGVAVPHSRAPQCPSLPSLFLRTGMALFVF